MRNQAAFAASSLYGPTNPKALEGGLIPAGVVQWLPSASQNLSQQIVTDQRWYASPEAEAALQRFTRFRQ